MKRLGFLGFFLVLLLAAVSCSQPPPSPPPATCSPRPTGLTAQGGFSEKALPQGYGDFFYPHVPGELLVLSQGLTPQGLVARLGNAEVMGILPGGFVHLRVLPGSEKRQAQALLQAGARWVQPNYLYYPLAFPNDPLYIPKQSGQLNGLVGLETAWARTVGDQMLSMAIIDTGYLAHVDMAGRWYLPSAQLDVADGDADPTDDTPKGRGHGLAVASVLGAVTGNALGMAGVTWQGRVLPLKVARSRDGEITTAYLATAVNRAVDLGARVVNLSVGGPISDPALENSLASARQQGVVLVAAVGNSGTDGIFYPAGSPSVIAVGAVNNTKQKAYFSNCGQELDLVAPGQGVVAALPNDDYGSGSGTSFAAPVVSGVVALYMSHFKAQKGSWPTPDQVYACLAAAAEDLGPSGHDTGYGFGLVRADRIFSSAYASVCFP
ncbi:MULTISPECIES: S8 family peptidase [Thermus]|nr:S8 family serine peptidase [Thermus brockianus]WCM39951.1 S8 family serine peptidase [Thermus antranikianii]